MISLGKIFQFQEEIFPLAVVFVSVGSFLLLLAVQCERKPVEVSTREKSSNCAASTDKIYIRKNLCSPLAATATFVTDKETARYRLLYRSVTNHVSDKVFYHECRHSTFQHTLMAKHWPPMCHLTPVTTESQGYNVASEASKPHHPISLFNMRHDIIGR